MELEKLATSAVVTELSKTDRLSSFINSGDKEPCWDGHIYIHEDRSKNKKNIKKVATQVKGKAVCQRDVNRTILYSISYDDLHAYMMNGGTMFFVVYLDRDTGDTLQIYYTGLLPVKIRELIKVKKNKYSVKFRKFSPEKLKKTELLINFYEDSRKQASFAGKDLPTIDDLSNQGVLESLTISYTGLGKYDDYSAFPKVLDGNSMTVYANIKGGTAPIPVEYYENVSHITMSNDNDIPVSVNERLYYTSFKTITTADIIEYHIGSSVRTILPNTGTKDEPVELSLKVSLKGKLSEQITAIEFITAMIEHGSFNIGRAEIPAKFSQDELERIKAFDFPTVLKGYKRAKAVLDSMNVKKDLDISKCTKDDLEKLNRLIGTIGDKLPVRGEPESPASVQKVTIANLTLAVVYLKKEGGGYYIFDYFGNHFEVMWSPDGSDPTEVSQFFSMGSDDYLTLDNLNLKTVVEDFKRVKPSAQHWSYGNNSMLYMLKAYDKSLSTELLDAARQMSEWLHERPDLLPNNITTLNRLQIAIRERALTFQEKSELYSIATSATDPFHRIGAFLLLDEQNEAEELFETLSEDELRCFKEFPIYKFYKNKDQVTD